MLAPPLQVGQVTCIERRIVPCARLLPNIPKTKIMLDFEEEYPMDFIIWCNECNSIQMSKTKRKELEQIYIQNLLFGLV